MSVYSCIRPEADYIFVRCDEEVEYENELWALLQRFDGQGPPDADQSLIVLCRTFSHL